MLHHPVILLIALAAVLFAAAVVRLVIGNPSAARQRVRVLRWRIRLYLRPSPGYANILELAVRWSRPRAVRIGRRARPSLPWWARMVLPVTTYAVRLGGAHFGRRVIASMEDQTLVLAAPRTGKSGWLADRIIDPPGRGRHYYDPHRPVRQHRPAARTPRRAARCSIYAVRILARAWPYVIRKCWHNGVPTTPPGTAPSSACSPPRTPSSPRGSGAPPRRRRRAAARPPLSR